MEAWWGHFPLCPFKRGATGAVIIGLGAGKFLGCEGFCPDFPKRARKGFVQLLPKNLLPQRSRRPLFGVTFKKGLMCFYASSERHFLKSNNVGRHFYADFQGICQDFQQIKTFGGALATPVSPSPTPLLFITVS